MLVSGGSDPPRKTVPGETRESEPSRSSRPLNFAPLFCRHMPSTYAPGGPNATPDIHGALGTARRAINMGSPGMALRDGFPQSRRPTKQVCATCSGRIHPDQPGG